MFDHSIRVPRLYKNASKIAKEVSEGKGSIKQLVYESKHPNIKALYALVVHTFQKTNDIDKLLKKSKLFVKEPRFDPWLAKILITELLWGKQRLAGQSKPVKTILAYEQIFRAHLSDVAQFDFQEAEQVNKPRYVRVNTLKVSLNEAMEEFINEGWTLKRYTDTDNYLGFLDAVANLGSEEFMIDLHIPYLLIFPPKTQFYQHQAYKNGKIILQDKASCLPVQILNPELGSTILDMCAAPGMKTTQCAAIVEDTGKIYAVEIGKKRYQTLCKIIESSGASCVETINADVLTCTGKQYPNVEYILVDPSCSGSGITDRVEIGQQEMEQHHNRLEKLAGFQIKTLRHALTRFPKAKRVVYSTCSVYPEENEDVVRQVLETCTTFKLVPADQFVNHKWQNFGSSDFGDIGNYCLYAKPDIDLTSGFFVAVFERLEEGESNQFLNARLYTFMKQGRSRKHHKEELQDEGEEGSEVPKKKKKFRKNEASEEIKHLEQNMTSDVNTNESKFKDEEQISEIPKKRKKSIKPEAIEEIMHFEKNLNSDINNGEKNKFKDELQDEGEQVSGILKKKKKSIKNELVDSESEEIKHLEQNKNKYTDEIKTENNTKTIKEENATEVHEPGDEKKYTADIPKKKKKKKEKRQIDDSTVESPTHKEINWSYKEMGFKGIEVANLIDEDTVRKSKKKKKEKDRNAVETDNTVLQIEEHIKKKKHKSEDVEEHSITWTETNKKKKLKSEEDSECTEHYETTDKKHKRRKKAQIDYSRVEEVNCSYEESGDVADIDAEDSVHKNKKKKKKKEIDNTVLQIEEDISGEHMKKKKKHKSKDVEEHNRTDTNKKKKHKSEEDNECIDEKHERRKASKKKKTKT